MLSAHAAVTDQLWQSLITEAPGFGTETGNEGVSWWVEVWDTTSLNYPLMSVENTVPSVGFTTAAGYNGYLINTFDFTATETDDVILRLYNGATTDGTTYNGESGWFIESAAVTLADLEAPIGGTDLDVAFDFSGATWQAVPEPATFLLFGIGGFGAWLLRRNKLKAKEEADA